ncbi:MAG TPA: hypothetical protein VEX68_18315 [Bryobacteraceae bacterium]|nr:hypothetical protein [Bryobacteraceae bacterium]
MASGQMSGVKRFLLWDYPRASWQYDVMVGLILAFIFLTPRATFRDQPRASSIVEIPSDQGRAFLLEARLLASTPDAERKARVEGILRSRYGKSDPVVKVEPVLDHEQEVSGFIAFTKH